MVIAVLLGPPPSSSADDQRPPGAAAGVDLSKRYPGKNPLLSPPLLPIADLRAALSRALLKSEKDEAFDAYRNGAVEMINPWRLSDKKIVRLLEERAPILRPNPSLATSRSEVWRGSLVTVDSVDEFLTAEDRRELRTNNVRVLVALSALNMPDGLHSEAVIGQILKKHRIGRDAIVLGGSERQHCQRCARLYPPGIPLVHAREYDLSVAEVASLPTAVERAKREAKDKGPDQQRKAAEKVLEEFETAKKDRNAKAAQQLGMDLEGVKDRAAKQESLVGGSLPSTFAHSEAPCPVEGIQGAGAHGLGSTTSQAVLLGAAARRTSPCDEQQPPAGRAGATGLSKVLAEPGMDPGGIDFSSMELRYLSDPGDGSGLQYSFSADRDPMKGDARTSTGLAVTDQTSDAFFVWLSLNPRAFWVNLNPNEPDRIVDSRLGRTDAGRIMLQADLRMKQTVAKLIHPDTATGREFWNSISGDCLSFRTWILSAPASVHQNGDKLYILDAPLDVQMETQYLQKRGDSKAAACPQQDKAAEDRNERLFRSLILPKLKHSINTAPEYSELRRVYLARVAAEWYRELSRTKATTYRGLVDKGDITHWQTESDWKPTDTFDQYVRSYTKGEFKVSKRTTSGDKIYVRTYSYGGVDLTRIPLRKVPDDRFTAQHAGLTKDIDQSLNAPRPSTGGDTVLLGAPTPRQAAGLGRPEEPTSPTALTLRLLPVLLLPLAALLWWRRRRLSASASASPLRRAAASSTRTGNTFRRPS
ncbi:hypothetical protein [Streptomyces lateritius]|uniref:hypothetical protein n=1 Tax=Streptomyces lateritius TaxID=67313 RepID=UPI0016747F48|nr:hypothetical protein [Streptomyces lateritius]